MLGPKARKGAFCLRPTMWKAYQAVGKAQEAARAELWAHPETARAEALPEGAQVAVETPFGRVEARVVHREDVPKGHLYLSALGPAAGLRVEGRVLVPAGGEA